MKSKKLIVAMVLIACLCMTTVAVAAGLYGGTVNWLGEVVPDEQIQIGETMPTAAPYKSEQEIDEEAVIEKATALYIRDGEMLVITKQTEDGTVSPVMSRGVICQAQSMADFREMLTAAPYLPLPALIPEGYEFVEGEVFYTCRPEGEWELVDRHELEWGIAAEQYRIHPGDEIADGYYLFFRSSAEDYHYAAITVMLGGHQNVNDQSFGFLAGQTAQRVDVPGMDNALAITGENTCTLAMRRVLTQPIECLMFWERIPQKHVYEEVHIGVTAPLLSTSTLISMFAAE